MTYDEIKQLHREHRQANLPFPITKRRKQSGYISVNDLVPIKIENVASFYDRTIDLPLRKSDGTEIGYVYFTKDMEVGNIHTLSEAKFVSYLIDIFDRQAFDSGSPHTFTSDYVIVYREFLQEYIDNFHSSAPIWGQFNHHYTSVNITPPISKSLSEIRCVNLPKFSKDKFYEASIRGIKQSLPFERFLKFYHLLELNFDSDVILRIQSLDIEADSESISMVLNEYRREDMERLKYLLHEYCSDVNALIDKMNSISNFLPIAKKIFFDFGKQSNPLNDFTKFSAVAVKTDGFNFANCKAEKFNSTTNSTDHEKFIKNLCAYWIYRVRNSIAHNKIGEYIMTQNDESFIINFAEPVLIEVLKQIYK